MRILDRFISFIFILLVIVLAVTIFLGATDIIRYNTISGILNEYVFVTEPKLKLEIAAVSILVILLGLKVTVFSADLSNVAKKNIVVNTSHGRIQISQDTIEEIATNVAKSHSEIKDISARMTKAGKGLNMYLMITVYKNAKINELLSIVQSEVKSGIETTTSVKVRNVDIKIKNIVQPSKNEISDKNIEKIAELTSNNKQIDLDATKQLEIEENANVILNVDDNLENSNSSDENDSMHEVEQNNN